MVICYEIVCSEKHIEDYGLCRVYGLAAYEQENRQSEPFCCMIEDISNDRLFVEWLYQLVEFNKVHPLHLKDVVIDVIS